MALIYSQYILCIAANAAENANGGLFIIRDTTFFRLLFIHNNSHSDTITKNIKLSFLSSSQFADNKWTELIILNTSRTNLDLSTYYLSKRAWVYQERFLIPRVLYFNQS